MPDAGALDDGRLLHREIPLLTRGLIGGIDADVGYNSDHGSPRQGAFGIANVQTLADGALTGPLLSGHGLVDDADEGRVGSVAHSEMAAGDEGNTESAEIVAIGLDKGSKPQLPSGDGGAFDGEAGLPLTASVRQRVG
jgi:hypothetical protein